MPVSLTDAAVVTAWSNSNVWVSGAVAEEMKAEQGSPAEAAGAPTPTQAATPEMSTAGSFTVSSLVGLVSDVDQKNLNICAAARPQVEECTGCILQNASPCRTLQTREAVQKL